MEKASGRDQEALAACLSGVKQAVSCLKSSELRFSLITVFALLGDPPWTLGGCPPPGFAIIFSVRVAAVGWGSGCFDMPPSPSKKSDLGSLSDTDPGPLAVEEEARKTQSGGVIICGRRLSSAPPLLCSAFA